MSLVAAQPSLAFRERLIKFLIPYFEQQSSNPQEVWTEAQETLDSYGARTRAEMINAARIIALSFTSLDLLAQAKAATDMPAKTVLRYNSCANSLLRSCQQNEALLAKRLACDVASATDAEPIDDLSDEELDAQLDDAQAKIDTMKHRLSGLISVNDPHALADLDPDPNQRPWRTPALNGPRA